MGNTGRTIQDREAIPFSHVSNTDDFLLQLLELKVQIAALLVFIGVVNRLNREFAHPLHHVGDGVGRSLCRLNQRDGIPGIPHGLVKAADLLGHARRDGEASRIILGGIDALTGRQLLHCSCLRPFG